MKTRSRSRSGPTVVDLASDPDVDVDDGSEPNISHEPAYEHVTKIGDVGYTFRKYFHKGWFEGKVVEIRRGADNGKNIRCEYEDGVVEDLSLAQLKAFAKTEHLNPHEVSYSQTDITEPKIVSPEKVEASNYRSVESFDEEDSWAGNRRHRRREYDDESPDCFGEEEQDVEPNGMCQYENGDVNDVSRTESKVPAKKKRKKNPRKGPKQTASPERIESSNANSPEAFNEEDYKVLYERYLTPRVREKAEIPGGMTLRRQTKDRIIDTPTPGYKKLKQKLDELLKKDRREEIYKILCQLRNWEMNPLRSQVWRQVGETDGDDVREYVDLVNDGEDHCIDVDRYIPEVSVDVKEEQEMGSDVVQSGSTVSKIQVTIGVTENATRIINEYISRVINTLVEEGLGELNGTEKTHRADGEHVTKSGPDTHLQPKNRTKKEQEEAKLPNELAQVTREGVTIEHPPIQPTITYSPAVIPKQEYLDCPDDSNRYERNDCAQTVQCSPARPGPTQPQTDFVQCAVADKTDQGTIQITEDISQTANSLLDSSLDVSKRNIKQSTTEGIIPPVMPCQSQHHIKKQQDEPKVPNQPSEVKKARTEGVNGTKPMANYKAEVKSSSSSSAQTKTKKAIVGISMPPVVPNGEPKQSSAEKSAMGEQTLRQTSQELNAHSSEKHINRTEVKTTANNEARQKRAHDYYTTKEENWARWNKTRRAVHCQSNDKIKEHQNELEGPNEVADSKHETVSDDNNVQRPDNNTIPASFKCKSITPAVANQVATVKTSKPRRNKKCTTKMRGERSSIEPKVKPEDAKCGKTTISLGNLPPPAPQLHLSQRTPYSPQLFSHMTLGNDSAPIQSFTSIRLNQQIHYAPAPKQRFRSVWTQQYHNRSFRKISLPVDLSVSKAVNKDQHKQTEKPKLVPAYRTKQVSDQRAVQDNLAACWRNQNKRRRKGEWFPQGRLTGKWKAPEWADGTRPREQKPATCKRVLLPVLKSLVNKAIPCSLSSSISVDEHLLSDPEHLTDIVCPFFMKPNLDALKNAHGAIQSLLPKEDCETFDVIRVARSYYDHWRPRQTKVILLAESHAFTEQDVVVNGPRLDSSVVTTNRYNGPREFVSLVYCLSYGENEALTTDPLPSNKGTPQFWCMLAACARGVDYVATSVSSSSKQITSAFAADVLKGGGLPVRERLNAKLEILEDLRERGIWLLDCSIFGWYIPQQQKFKRSTVSNEIHRMAKERPPPYMKAPSLVLSYELFTKHLIREIAEEGHLQLVIPIGREVEQTITRDRLIEAVRIPGSNKAHARIVEAFPAPNAWIPGGYSPFHAKLAALIQSVVPTKAKRDKQMPTPTQKIMQLCCTDLTWSSK